MTDVIDRVHRLADLQSRRVIAMIAGRDLEPDEVRELERLTDDPEVAAAIAARDARERQQRERDEARRELAKRSQRILRSGVPIDDRDVFAKRIASDQIDDTRALRGVRWWHDDERGRATLTLVLLGTTGVGKTVAAAWAISRSPFAVYVKARELCRLYRSEYGPERERWERLLAADLVVVDELGMERDLDLARAAWCDLIDERHADRLRTLGLGNLTKAAFGERYDDRSSSRLEQRGLVVELDDQHDRRRRQQSIPATTTRSS